MPESALRRIVVVPDLHGCITVLERLLLKIGFVDADGLVTDSDVTLVQLGDLVDRGPESKKCVERMMDLQAAAPARVIVLKGNHEDMVLRAEGDFKISRLWLMECGGGQTLRAYAGCEGLIRFGGAHYAWFKGLPHYWEYQGVLFCHAGLAKARKGMIDLEGLLWDRPPVEKGPFRAVVCGHTPTEKGKIEENRGVWRCDVGLGRGANEDLVEVLSLEISGERFVPRILTV
jgi:serine/threonine protein phosphatase 1